MAKMHKHAGVVRSDTGTYRMHPISIVHKDAKAKRYHNVEIKKQENTSTYKTTPKKVSGNHTHKGITRANGRLRAHPINQIHKDSRIQALHNAAIKSEKKQPVESVKKQPLAKNKKPVSNIGDISVPLDSHGYISINLDKTPVKGIRLSLTRRENKKRRTIAIQIDNKPCKLVGGERITSSKELIADINKL